jgi:hypothetical protein
LPVKRRRRLRKLAPDEELLRRRAAGEPLRQLAADYRVAHTTLCRYFARPEVKKQLELMVKQQRAEQRRVAAGRVAERRLERSVRKRAEEQVAREWQQERLYRREVVEWNMGRRFRGDGYAAWLDQRDAPKPRRRRADRHNTYDKEAEEVVGAGGGVQALLEKTELPTVQAAADCIDPQLLTQVFDNDARARAQPRPLELTLRPRLRRLVADTQLLRRRAAGEPLWALADDYDVARTTLVRFFARPEIRRLLRQTVHELQAERRGLRRNGRTQREPVY